jgi:exopolyphosphatase/guanosine-5'-triphosphate,3'-diphosphate pyrophosphatase
LGFDVFENGKVSHLKGEKVVAAMQVFQSLLAFYDVKHLKACATSAMRDAQNGDEIIKKVEHQTGIKIDIISGDEEAVLVNENHIAENMDKEHGYLYINVGGGSTDVIFYEDGKLRYKKSFNVGTIRLLKNLITEDHWNNLKAELKANVKSNLPLVAIGSGGNINKIFSLSKKKEGKPLSLDHLKKYYDDFSSISVEERIHRYKLREDRADVIVPALQIYIHLMAWTNIKDIYIPKIGLVDGLAHALYQEIVNKL